jgi:hypothetical protein
MGAYAMHPVGSDAVLLANGMPRARSLRDGLENKGLAADTAASRLKTSHRCDAPFTFPAPFMFARRRLGVHGASGTGSFSVRGHRLAGPLPILMESIAIVDWTSVTPLFIVIWCDATM